MVQDYLTIAEAARLIETRALSPVELVENRLDRIARLDSRLHSFVRVLADDARREARAAEAEIATGRYRGPMHGAALGGDQQLAWRPRACVRRNARKSDAAVRCGLRHPLDVRR